MMKLHKPSWQAVIVILLCIAAAPMLPLLRDMAPGTGIAVAALLLLGSLATFFRLSAILTGTILFLSAHISAWLLISSLTGHEGTATTSFYLLLAAAWLSAWNCVSLLSSVRLKNNMAERAMRLLIPLIFGAWILILWEAITRGAGVPFILLPPPSAIGIRLINSLPIIAADVRQTVFKAVLAGYVIGCGSGFLVALLADRVDFLRRGLLPIGNMVSALPMIGIAPVMVMWFGFDWQSKAAVVVVTTFFPMLVNTVAGLQAANAMERDLMHTYAADWWQTLVKLRLPAAWPFIFNALKINSTLALICAIVAEFFGTPIVGMGFRISTEIGRMNVDMVWAEIAVASVIGSVFYGLIALAERAATFWHPSVRGGRA